MRVLPYTSEFFGFDGRGPEIHRFIHDRDALKQGAFPERRPPPGGVIGVEYFWFEHPDMAWVIFKKRQVVQVVPEEVCSYWFTSHVTEQKKGVGIYTVEDSAWLRSFSQHHLSACRHFILMFYDDIIEVIAEDLLFGRGAFRIDDHPELSYYK
jgi:hypothetical protein